MLLPWCTAPPPPATSITTSHRTHDRNRDRRPVDPSGLLTAVEVLFILVAGGLLACEATVCACVDV